MIERVVTPVDGSETAEFALDYAVELARLAAAPLHLVRVVDLVSLERIGVFGLGVEGSALRLALDDERRAADVYLAEIAGRVGAAGQMVTTERREGFAAREIVAATRPGDALVIASHGRTGVKRWLLGSVAEEVLRNAVCPVTLIRFPGEANAGDGS